MKGCMFNIDNGYLEGLCRGFKNGILGQNDYLNLVQCETLEDLKLHLQSTDYSNFLNNESSLQVSVIEDKLREKLVTEFQHMRNQSTGQLAMFLDFITYGYMIDNIVLLITGTLHQRPISELVRKSLKTLIVADSDFISRLENVIPSVVSNRWRLSTSRAPRQSSTTLCW